MELRFKLLALGRIETDAADKYGPSRSGYQKLAYDPVPHFRVDGACFNELNRLTPRQHPLVASCESRCRVRRPEIGIGLAPKASPFVRESAPPGGIAPNVAAVDVLEKRNGGKVLHEQTKTFLGRPQPFVRFAQVFEGTTGFRVCAVQGPGTQPRHSTEDENSGCGEQGRA